MSVSSFLVKCSVSVEDLEAAARRIPGWSIEDGGEGNGEYFPRSPANSTPAAPRFIGEPWTKKAPRLLDRVSPKKLGPSAATEYNLFTRFDFEDLHGMRKGGLKYRPEQLRSIRQDLRSKGEDPLADNSAYRRRRMEALMDRDRFRERSGGKETMVNKGLPVFADPRARTVPHPVRPGHITVSPDPTAAGALVQKADALKTLMHEVSERRAEGKNAIPAWSHLSPTVLFNESNLARNYTGEGAAQVVASMKNLRRSETGEAADLDRMVRLFSGGKQGFQYGEDKMPKAMKKAIVRWLQRAGR